MPATVECRSDHAYLGYPLAFYWHEQRIEVERVLVENHTPRGYSFLVSTEVLGVFVLDYDIHTDQWSVQQLLSKERA